MQWLFTGAKLLVLFKALAMIVILALLVLALAWVIGSFWQPEDEQEQEDRIMFLRRGRFQLRCSAGHHRTLTVTAAKRPGWVKVTGTGGVKK